MKNVSAIVVVLVVALVVWVWYRNQTNSRTTLRNQSQGATRSPSTATAPAAPQGPLWEMRTKMLEASAANSNMVDAELSGGVWGCLMEMGRPNGYATLVCLADGTVSMYMGEGGVIGAGAHENVRQAAEAFLRLADQELPKFHKVEQPSYPATDCVHFYLLTNNGTYTTGDFDDRSLENKQHPFSPLFYAGHAVMTQVRTTTQK